MRCTSCNKFVSFDCDNEPEDQGFEVSVQDQSEPFTVNDKEFVTVTLEVTGSIRMVNNCADCGQEMAEANLELTGHLDIEVPAVRDESVEGGIRAFDDAEFSIDIDSISREDELQRTDRRGKPIKKMRFMKHLYYGIVEYMVTGPGESTAAGTLKDYVTGSDFEDIQ